MFKHPFTQICLYTTYVFLVLTVLIAAVTEYWDIVWLSAFPTVLFLVALPMIIKEQQ